LLQIKSKHRSGLNVEDDLRCALSSTSPRFKKLAAESQAQFPIRRVLTSALLHFQFLEDYS
jgi:hypothetical protein